MLGGLRNASRRMLVKALGRARLSRATAGFAALCSTHEYAAYPWLP